MKFSRHPVLMFWGCLILSGIVVYVCGSGVIILLLKMAGNLAK